MKKLTFLFLFILVGCSESEIPSHLLLDNGGVFYEVGKKTPFNGTTIENKDGKLFKKTFYLEGKMYEEIEFYNSGSVKQILKKNGNDISISLYDYEGLDISNSEVVNYYDNGFVKEKGKYLNGLKEDKWEYFYEDGELIQREYWSNGKKLTIIDYDNLIEENNKIYVNDISNNYSNRKPFNGMLRDDSYNIDFIKITNGNIGNLAESYDEETGYLINRSTCISKNEDWDDWKYSRVSVSSCLRINIENPKEENEEITKEIITELGENLWELTYEVTTNNKVWYIEKHEYIINEGEILPSYDPSNLTFVFSTYENGNIHTKTSFANGEIEYKRFNKDGLDISNGEELGTAAGWSYNPDSIYAKKGKFKNGVPDGVWTSGNGNIETYKNGVLNGLYKSFWSDNCLWQEGKYVDGYREGEWIEYETYPKDNCGKIEDVKVYFKGELKE